MKGLSNWAGRCVLGERLARRDSAGSIEGEPELDLELPPRADERGDQLTSTKSGTAA